MKIIDLVKNDDGEFVPKKNKMSKINKFKRKDEWKDVRNSNLSKSFFDGMDLGLDFFDNLNERLIRINKLKW